VIVQCCSSTSITLADLLAIVVTPVRRKYVERTTVIDIISEHRLFVSAGAAGDPGIANRRDAETYG